MEMLMGKREYACTPWGHADVQHFRLAEAVLLAAGRATRTALMNCCARPIGNATAPKAEIPKCANCMVHSGYEASAVNHMFGSLGGFVAAVKATFSSYKDPDAMGGSSKGASSDPGQLVQIMAAPKA